LKKTDKGEHILFHDVHMEMGECVRDCVCINERERDLSVTVFCTIQIIHLLSNKTPSKKVKKRKKKEKKGKKKKRK
jgi:hypothetical protein